jgi:hypothetical protein
MSSCHIFKNIVFFSFINLLTSFTVFAQEVVEPSSANEFRLALTSEIGSIDNFLFDSDDEQSTAVLMFAPSVFLKAQHQQQLVTLSLNTSHFAYQDFSQDNHTDFDLNVSHQYKLAHNKSWFVDAQLLEKYQLRGTGLSLGEASTLNKGDKKQTYSVSTGYFYGSEVSVAKLTFELGLLNDSFNTRRQQTRLLDKENQFIQVGFDYLMSGQSYFATDFIYDNISAKYNPSQDKQKYTGLLGFKWRSSVMTQVEILLGYKQIKFKANDFQDQGTFSWRANIDWSPVAITQITFSTGRDIEEANKLTNSFRLVDSYQIDVLTDLNDRLQSSVNLRYQDETIFFEDSDIKEAYVIADMMLKYKRNQWLSIFIKYSYSDLQDTPSTISYQRNGISLGFNVTI